MDWRVRAGDVDGHARRLPKRGGHTAHKMDRGRHPADLHMARQRDNAPRDVAYMCEVKGVGVAVDAKRASLQGGAQEGGDNAVLVVVHAAEDV